MNLQFVRKSIVFSAILFISNSAFAINCPDPNNQCPAFGSGLSEAIGCGWKIPLLAPDDPLTQLVVAGTPIPVGPNFKDGLAYCMYANTSMGTPATAPLTYKLFK